MEIKDKDGKVRIKFESFNKVSSDPIFVEFDVSILMGYFTAKERITAELSDFLELVEHNNRLVTSVFQSRCYFQHNDEYLQLRFDLKIPEGVLITGFLKDHEYTNKLDFSFLTTQLEMACFNDQLKVVCQTIG